MKRSAAVLAAALATMTAAGIADGSAAHAGTAPAPQAAALAGSAPSFPAGNRPLGTVAGAVRLTIQVWLKPRTGAESYATAVSTPGDPLFRHYLSPAAYPARFGAPETAAASVESWLASVGFSGVTADPGRDYVRATAPVSTIDTAFRLQLRYYRPTSQVNAGPHELRANDGPVWLPSSVAASVLGITGLDNAAPATMLLRPGGPAGDHGAGAGRQSPPRCSSYYGQHYARGLPRVFGTTSLPTAICGYSARQIRRAYGYNRRNAGKDVTIALVVQGLVPDMFATLRDYAAANRIQAPAAGRYAELSLGRGDACGDPFDGEEQLDVEASYALAPLASQLVVGGDSCDNGDFGLQGLYDADTAVLNGAGGHPLAQIASNSWDANSFSEALPDSLLKVEHAYLVRAAVEGVSMIFASGDRPGVVSPASDPFVTAVGGTSLGIGNKDARLFETGWSAELYVDSGTRWIPAAPGGAAGGGQSQLWAQPEYQRSVVPARLATAPGKRSGLVRAVPDISADADPDTGFMMGQLISHGNGSPARFFQSVIGGTSLAAPLVAAMVADAEQYQRRPFGFLNPALYRLAGTSAIHDTLPVTSRTPSRYRGVLCDGFICGGQLEKFDVQSHRLPGYAGQVTLKGYDTMTGIGTPAGQNFVYALRRLGLPVSRRRESGGRNVNHRHVRR